MMLTEMTQIPEAALPLDALKAHLRLGRGFGPDDMQDSLLIGFLRAAIAAIEARTSKALIERDFSLSLSRWRQSDQLIFPVAPVTVVQAMTHIDAQGEETEIAVDQYFVEGDAHGPRLRPRGSGLPTIARAETMRIDFLAGLSPTATGLPSDLFQAVMMLASHYYEHRTDTALHGGCMPFGVTSLIERYRNLRLTLGAAT